MKKSCVSQTQSVGDCAASCLPCVLPLWAFYLDLQPETGTQEEILVSFFNFYFNSLNLSR